MFKLEVRRILSDKIFLFVTLFILFFYIYVNLRMQKIHFISDNNFYMRLFFLSPDNIELTNIYNFLIPLLSSLVGSDLLGRDIRTKEYLNIISRYNRQKVVVYKALTSFLVGGFIVVLPYLLDFIIKIAIYPINLPSITLNTNFQSIVGMSSIFVYHPMIYTIISIIATFLFAGLCSLIGFLVSFFTKKKIIIVSVPFLISIAIWNLINIFGIKDYSISSILIFRIAQNVFSLGELVILFLVPFILVLTILAVGVKKYEFI